MFGIITALPHEYAAVKAMLMDPVDIRYSGAGAGRRFTVGHISSKKDSGKHKIALALLSSMGNNMASTYATLMLEQFKDDNLEAILMVGIAGGCPNPKNAESHVRLGDVVVSNDGGVIQYDNIKTTLHKGILPIFSFTVSNEIRTPLRAPSAKLLEAFKLFDANKYFKEKKWTEYITLAQKHLSGFDRPSPDTDILRNYFGRSIKHPLDRNRKENEPKVFSGKIGSANTLLKNPILRDSLRDKYGIRANEMEGSGIADATWISGKEGYFVIRGICDYCDKYKNDDWQNYAALAAAAFAKALIESIPANEINPNFYTGQLTEAHSSKHGPMENNPYLTRYFVGRQALLETIINNISNNSAYGMIALVEKGGIGKTALAAAIAEKLRKQPLHTEKFVFWADLKNEKPIDAAVRWLKYFGLNYENERDERTVLNKLSSVISTTPCVIVLDNCQQRNVAEKLIVQSSNVNLILTSRDRSAVPSQFKFESIAELNVEDSLSLIKKFIGEKRFDENIKAVESICVDCGGLPLALIIAGSELRNEVRWRSMEDYVRKLKEAKLETLSPNNKSDESIRATFDISYDNLSIEQKTVFDSLGIFSGNQFQIDAVNSMHTSNPTAILQQLADLSLIAEFGNNRFNQHDLILSYANEKFKLNRSNQIWSDRLLSFYSLYIEKNRKNYIELDTERQNIFGLLLATPYNPEPDLKSYFNVLKNLHPYLKDRGLWHELLNISQTAYKLFDGMPGEKAFIATWLLSWVHFQQSNFEKALAITEEGLSFYDQAIDPEGKAAAKRRLGMTLIELGKYDEAEKWLNEAKKDFEELKLTLKIGDTLCLLGLLERKKEGFDENIAEKYLKDSLKLVEGDEKETSMTLYGLGRLKAVCKEFAASVDFHSQALVIDKQAKRMPGIAYNTFRIGQIELLTSSTKDEAKKKLEEARAIFATLGNLKRVRQIDILLK